MSEELDKQLTDFLLANNEYEGEVVEDLFNLLKCHLGKYVKECPHRMEFDNRCYCLVTDIFIGYLYDDNYFGMTVLHILYKNKSINVYDISCEVNPYFQINEISDIDMDRIKSMFYSNDLWSFRNRIHGMRGNRVNDVDANWLFATIPTKSARN